MLSIRRILNSSSTACLVVLLSAAVCAPQAQAGPTIRISQESSPNAGDWSSHVLGFIEGLDTGQTAAAYYNANPNFGGPAPALIKEATNLFLVQASNGLHLFIVHDALNAANGGHADMKVQLFGDSNGGAIGVRDDGDDAYTGASGATVFTAVHNWPAGTTDGWTIGSIEGNWSILVEYTAPPSGLGCWAIHSKNGAVTTVSQATGRRVRLDIIPQVPCPTATPDAGCANFPNLRGGSFPPAGLDVFSSGASFKVVMLDGTEGGVGVWVDHVGVHHGTPVVDPATVVGRSNAHYHGSQTDILGTPVAGAGQPPYEDLPSLVTDPCVFPANFPHGSAGGREVHTQMLRLNMNNAAGDYVKAGQAYFDSVDGTAAERFFQPSFGEVQGLGNEWPADSVFNMYVEVYSASLNQKFYNKSPMLVRSELTQFPPNLNLPRSIYLHDPSFAAVPLMDADGIHVAYLLSAGHGAVDVSPTPSDCDIETILSRSVSFTLDNGGVGTFPPLVPNHARNDQGQPEQQVTVYVTSGANPGAPPDITNSRIGRLTGSAARAGGGNFATASAVSSFSYGKDGSMSLGGGATPGALVFSVDRNAIGEACSDVRVSANPDPPGQPGPLAEQAADLYVSTVSAWGAYGSPYLPSGDPGSNTLLADQTVLGLRPLIEVMGEDNLMGLELSPFGTNDRAYLTMVGHAYECKPIGPGQDCNSNGIADGCEQDCNTNGKADDCDIAQGTSQDANSNGIPDECEPCTTACIPQQVRMTAWIFVYDDQGDPQAHPFTPANLQVFATASQLGLLAGDIIDGLALSDVTPGNPVPTPNGVRDASFDDVLFSLAPGSPSLALHGWSAADILRSRLTGTASVFAVASSMGLLPADNIDALDIAATQQARDCNCNGQVDDCDVARAFSGDCNNNGIPDECELAGNDCNCNDTPDECDLLTDTDCDNNGVPDACQPDCNGNSVADTCDIAGSTSTDCNDNDVPDECDPAGTLSMDVTQPSDRCVKPGEPLTVTLRVSCLAEAIRGYQAFVSFDSSKLSFNGGSYVLTHFGRPIISPIAAQGNNIDLAAGLDYNTGQQPVTTDSNLVNLQFVAGANDATTKVSFRCNYPPTRLTDANGESIDPVLIDTPTFYIDGTPPQITCPSNITEGNDIGFCGGLVSIPPATASDPNGSGVESITAYRADGLGLGERYPVGTTQVTWVATDCAGNTSSCTMSVTVNDTEQPAITCPANVQGPNAALGTCEATVIVPRPTTSDNCEVATVTNSWTGTDDASGVYPVGVTTVTWTVTDIYGNTRQCSHTVAVGDAQPPTITCPANVFDTTDPGLCTGTVTLGTPTTGDNCPAQVTVSNNAPPTFPLGSTVVTWTATDGSGNTAQCTQLVTIRDNEPPSVTCPATVTHTADPGLCQATFGFAGPTYSDNCGVASVTNSKTGTSDPTSIYPVGTTPVTWTVTDNAGNPSTCTHNVVVSDDELPVVTCGPDVTTNADAGSNQTFVDVPPPTATDNCAIGPRINSYTGTADASAVYYIGTTTVTWTVFDTHGNAQTCQQDITVLGVNRVSVDVQLSPIVTGPFTRCITFVVFACDTSTSVEREVEIAFDVNGFGTAVFETPYDVYHCITARDELHTLRRTDDGLHIVGSNYVADFTGDPMVGGDWLVGGNLNDDKYIDILDFGIFVNQYGVDYGSGNTTCTTLRPHADITGNGIVDLAEFTFIQINFLKVSEPNCCNLPFREGSEPLRSIRTREARKYGILPSADLNGDGFIDEYDMVEFMNGGMPEPPQPVPTTPVAEETSHPAR